MKKPLLDEITELLSSMIRFDTTNPPGNELPLAEFIRDLFVSEGISAQVFESAPGRGNVVARVKGNGSKKPLLLLNHLDVVPAEKDKWQVDPFSGTVKGGCVWGRGALDIKGMGAMEILTLLRLKREGVPLARDVIYVGAADEETGGKMGADWLVRNHLDALNAEYAINEGGFTLLYRGKTVFYCQCAEKTIIWARVKVKGKGGHASIPHPENPILRLSQGIDRIDRGKFPPVRNKIAVAIMSGLSGVEPLHKRIAMRFAFTPLLWRAALRVLSKDKLLNAILRNTATPTVVKGGERTNVIPSEAEFSLDCRVFPDTDPKEFASGLRRILGKGFEVEIVREHAGTESPMQTELWTLLEGLVKEKRGDAIFLPYLSPGGTDSGSFRPFGIVCYGFDPTVTTEEEIDTVHGIDERISQESLVWGAEFLYETAKRFCT
ncbi:MAG: M20/M25/M40 family metallo-hydrolase [Candidatus Eisenbacteria bacterium]|nr:M20/M25/M40 family metallo-hydrolase [Candidatus Eisenbacteria bacterium]